MSHRSLTRAEAAERGASITVQSMLVELELGDQSGDTFRSRTTIEFGSAGAESFVDFQGRQLTAATLNGAALDPGSWRDGRIPLTDLRPRNILVIDGVMAYSSDGEGLHRHVDPEDQQAYLYAMSFLDAGPRWFAAFDQPDLKARYTLLVTAPPEWTVLGNGPSEALGVGRWRIAPLEPLSTYFVTLVAGPYASFRAEHDGIRLGFHVRASLRNQLSAEADDLVEVTSQCLDYYHQIFATRYPFGEYHQAFVPDFNAGAMENPGCVTLRDQLIFRGRATRTDRGGRASVIAHEMAHMWFGDLVTMAWWDDLWLNESLAEYMAHRATAVATRYDLWSEFGIVRKDWGAVADQSPATHPVAGNGALDSAAALQDFDGISYAKGAAVVRQLAARLGDEVFLGGLRAYFARHAFGNATFADLIAAWTAAGAPELPAWADAWLHSTGMDTIDVAGQPPAVTVSLARPNGAPTAREHTVRIGAVTPTGEVSLAPPVTITGPAVPVSQPPDTILTVPDARDQTWAKIRFGPDGWAGVAAALPLITDETVLVVIYNAIRDAVREASLDPVIALDLIGASLASKQPDSTVTSVATFALGELAATYSPVEERAARRARVHSVARDLLAGAPAGSDRQLTAFRLAVTSADDPDLLLGWLDGSRLPTGIDLDPELRWAVVGRLAAREGDPDLIGAALAQDPSAAAQVHAARARAAVPTAEAKAAAWTLLMRPSTATAYEIYATGQGFYDPAHTALTAAHAAAYFDEIASTAGFRSGWVLGQVAGYAFPWTSVTAETLARADGLLATDLAPPVRRSVSDGADRIRRALTSLRRFGGVRL